MGNGGRQVGCIRCANSFSPIQPVTNGVSDSQNSRCRLAQSTAPLIRGVQHVVVVVPVGAEEDEAEDIGEEDTHHRRERGPVAAVLHAQLELEHHDRDQYRDQPVAEGLEPSLSSAHELCSRGGAGFV